uniref:BAH domain-containing protein n=1 Tax=Kalanchoe fedtschenkoi TaxID=63787 RepID=A0A7N0U1T2_KALFE
MAANGCYFVEWKEEYVSQERGKRVVHYFLKDSAGVSVLAVIGTERSLRHMFYVVADDFLRICGEDQQIQAGFKWRSRREVVDWLTSMLSKQHLFRDRKAGGTQSQSGYISDYMGCLARSFREQSSEISWSGTAWMCGKQLKHYPSFCRNGITIKVQSFVFIMAQERDGYLAYLEDMYEDRKGLQKVKVRWFHHHQEVKGVVPLRNFHPKEVFITPYAQVLSAECVDGLAMVLTPEHYEQFSDVFPPALSGSVHVCFRQFKSNRVKPFDLSNLHGYYDQAIFSCLNPDSFSKQDAEYGLVDKEDEEFVPWYDEKKGSKRSRGGRGLDRFSTDHSGPRNSIKDADMWADDARHDSFGNGLFNKRPRYARSAELRPCSTLAYSVDDEIEVLSQDSGIRGCWFKCTVVEVSRKQLKVQYNDVQDEEGGDNLEEWIPAFRIAKADPLGMRFLSRPTIRPALLNSQQVSDLKVGDAIDAWWNDGWWEGVVTDVGSDENDIPRVYLPGENLHLTMAKKDLRISRDWTGDQWVDVEAKLDICAVIPLATINADLSIISVDPKDGRPEGTHMPSDDACVSTKLHQIEEETDAVPPSSSHPGDLDQNTCVIQLEDQHHTEMNNHFEQPHPQLELNGEAKPHTRSNSNVVDTKASSHAKEIDGDDICEDEPLTCGEGGHCNNGAMDLETSGQSREAKELVGYNTPSTIYHSASHV